MRHILYKSTTTKKKPTTNKPVCPSVCPALRNNLRKYDVESTRKENTQTNIEMIEAMFDPYQRKCNLGFLQKKTSNLILSCVKTKQGGLCFLSGNVLVLLCNVTHCKKLILEFSCLKCLQSQW